MHPPLAPVAVVVLALLLAAPSGRAATDASAPGIFSRSQGPVYRVGAIELEYAESHPLQPPIAELVAIDLALGEAEDGYVGPRRGARNVYFTLSELSLGAPVRIYASGIRELNEQLVEVINRRGLAGVYVAPHDEDIDAETGADLRVAGNTTLRLVIYTGWAWAVRTVGTGGRIPPEERENHPSHKRIARHSPVQPADASGRAQADLLLREKLDDYLSYLNRHPGRRVDLAVTPSRQAGGVFVDYLVAENRPWILYSQFSNTGTDATTDRRQRFGFQHTQLTGRDDVLQVEYVTGDFDEVNAVFGSYGRPVPLGSRTRMRVRGSWSDYDASQFGFPGDAFEGTQWDAGAELLTNVYQRRDLFVDVSAGVRWWNVEAENLDIDGEEHFFLPSFGLNVERLRDASNLHGALRLERNFPSIAGTSSGEEDLFRLGRPEVDDDWMLLRGHLAYSFYLEPLLDPRGWRNPRTPSSSTLAHELALEAQTQFAFGTRLIPQTQMVFGGFYTVRGYPQAVLAADSGILLRTEYRYHWPRSLRPEPQPRRFPILGGFRMAPQRVYGRPDWDLVFRTFFDFGRALYSDSVSGEEDETLAGVGFGVEVAFKRYLALRFDWAWALRDARDVESGDKEAYVIATLRY